MAEVAPAPATPVAKAPKRTPKKPRNPGPSVGQLIVTAVSASKERNGLSFPALKKELAAGGYDVEKNNSRIKTAVRSLVTKGVLNQTRGSGASGSFKINKKQVDVKSKPVKKEAKPKAPKSKATKSAANKKPVGKKVAAKKTAKKPTKKPKKVTSVVKKASKGPTKKVTKKLPTAAKKTKASPKKAKALKPKTKTAAAKKK